jgi:hypothetical protein
MGRESASHPGAHPPERGPSGFGEIDRRLQERARLARMTDGDPRFATSACVNGINVEKVPDFLHT